MLNTLFHLFQQDPLPLETIKGVFQAHHTKLKDLACVCGSFKTIYPFMNKFALATVKGPKAKEMLIKEQKLITKLAENGLPTIKFHSDVFELANDRQAVLLQWVPATTLIDVKDEIASSKRKLMAVALGIEILSGEAWVLQKSHVEKQIKCLFLENPALFLQVKKFALKLQHSIRDIVSTLEAKDMLIADLQLLVSIDGQVVIIDPIDIVNVSRQNNAVTYHSFLDEEGVVQDNPDFVKLLYQGKDLLNQCLTWCNEVAKLSSNAEALQLMIPSSKQTEYSARDIHKSMMKQNLANKSLRNGPIAVIASPLVPPETARPPLPVSPSKRKAIPQENEGSPKKEKRTPQTSPAKPLASLTMNESVQTPQLESPTKLIAHQFAQVALQKPVRFTSSEELEDSPKKEKRRINPAA